MNESEYNNTGTRMVQAHIHMALLWETQWEKVLEKHTQLEKAWMLNNNKHINNVLFQKCHETTTQRP